MSEWDDIEDEPGDDEPGGRRLMIIAVIISLLVALGGVIAYRALKEDPTTAASTPRSTTPVQSATSTSDDSTATTVESVPSAASASTGDAASSSATADTTSSPVATTGAPTTADATTAPPATAPPAVTETEAPTAAPGNAPSYPIEVDGTPSPVIAIFNTDQITISGVVPDQAAKDYLQTLAIANSKTPAPVANLLTIDPTIPRSVGVRVVELDSPRFAPGSARVEPAHAREIDRIASFMNALPNVSVLIIGHSDQIGSSDANYRLSAARAAAVVDYLVGSGISPARLSSRAVGDRDLLTLNNDAASLALNRRTEFIMYGLIGPT